MLCLGIESSCDETALAVVRDGVLLDAVLAAVVVPVIVAVHLTGCGSVGKVVDAGVVDHIAGQGTVAHEGGFLAGHMILCILT